MTDPTLLAVNVVRGLAMDAVQKANSGHPGMPMGAAPMAVALWSRHLRFDPTEPTWHDRDRFILSCGHGSMLLYALLHLSGYDLPMEELMRFRQLNSVTPGHPESQLTPGVEMATGPLGQGLAHAVGQAMAERFLAARFNRPGHTVVDHHTYVIVSDGDLMEGISSEAASLAGHHRLSKLIFLYDSNQISIDGTTGRTFTEDVRARFDAFGWQTLLVEAGNDIEAISAAIDAAKADQNRPSLIEIRTVIGFGSPAKAGTAKSHGSPLGPDEVTATKKALGLPDTPFFAPPEAYAFFALAAEKGKEERIAFEERMDRYRTAFPTEAAELERVWAGEWDESWLGSVEGLDTAAATRKHGETVLQAIAAKNPTVLGGSADLFESTFTHVKDSGPFEPENPTGRNLYFGVREHAMAAAVNGMTMHGGVKPIASTFLMFADYCRPSIRLASLMECPSVYVFTHDSIGVGEDGPTHQPIEHLASLRAIPHVDVIRPCDGNETAIAWAQAMRRTKGPTLLILSRQSLPPLTPAAGPDHPAFRGAYVLSSDKEPEIALIGTGSEVQHCVAAAETLRGEGRRVRVVSMPCWSIFEAQPSEYRQEVLPRDLPAVSCEAATTFGWARYAQAHVGVDDFGRSAPFAEVMEFFGINADHVAEQARNLLRGSGR